MIRFALALICLCGAAQADPTLRASGVLRWQLDAPWFGGWSAIEVGTAGGDMTVISDRGQILRVSLLRVDGRLTGITARSTTQLGPATGNATEKKAFDAEGLAVTPDGRAFVSFEHRHRITQVDLATGQSSGHIGLPFQNTMGDNSGVEALAVGPDGTLYALAEQAQPGAMPFPLYAYSKGSWRVAAHIPKRGPFVPVGADFDAKGRLWVLERAATPLGFRSRIRMFVIDPAAPREHVLLTTTPARFDNLEGISLWQDADGQTRLTMISDDNFLRIQQTQIVEYLVRE